MEIGWSDLEVKHEDGAQWFGPEAKMGARLPMFQWHSESFSIPRGAQWLALDATELCGNTSPDVQRPEDILPTLTEDIARSQAIASCI